MVTIKRILVLLWCAISVVCFSDSYAANAGVLPCTKMNGIWSCLFSQESCGDARKTWADCGGGGSYRETSKKTALREFIEETRATYGYSLCQRSDLRKALQERCARKEFAFVNKKYVKRRMSKPLIHPNGYSLHLASVYYHDAENFMRGPGKDREKDAFEWWDIEDVLANLKECGTNRVCYKGRQIRSEMVLFLRDPMLREQLRARLNAFPDGLDCPLSNDDVQ